MLLRVEPQRLVATLESGWPRRRQHTAASAPADSAVPRATGESDKSSGLDAEMLEAVLQELELSAPLRGAGLFVEVADPLVHFDVAEGDFGTQNDRQLQAIAAACMAELLGEASGEYEVRWSLQSGARQLLIAALPRECIATLEGAARLRGLRLESVQPGFARRWNAFARTLKGPTAVFATTSGTHAVLACIVDRAARAVSVGPWQDDDNAATPGPSTPDQGTHRRGDTSLLDARASRLLASLGIAADSDPEYLLVSDDAAAATAPSRWSVVNPEGAAA